jgi:hypothetical protein
MIRKNYTDPGGQIRPDPDLRTELFSPGQGGLVYLG